MYFDSSTWAQFLQTQHVKSLSPSRSPKSTSSPSPAELFPETVPPVTSPLRPTVAVVVVGGVGVADGEGVCDLPVRQKEKKKEKSISLGQLFRNNYLYEKGNLILLATQRGRETGYEKKTTQGFWMVRQKWP